MVSMEPAALDAQGLGHRMQVRDRVGHADEVPGVIAVEGQMTPMLLISTVLGDRNVGIIPMS